jgi:hypothetical protein
MREQDRWPCCRLGDRGNATNASLVFPLARDRRWRAASDIAYSARCSPTLTFWAAAPGQSRETANIEAPVRWRHPERGRISPIDYSAGENRSD